jgi:hypothetical protein
MAIRSGRFRIEIPTPIKSYEGEIIIDGRGGAFYRFFNSGKTDFTIKSGSGGPSDLVLKPRYSIDLAVGSAVLITGSEGAEVEGIYEFLDGHAEVRSGRFNFKFVTEFVQIIDFQGGFGGSGDTAWYRIFNSGDKDLEVHRTKAPNGTPLKTLKPDQSFDFSVGRSTKDVFVRGTLANDQIEGIYEYLGKD